MLIIKGSALSTYPLLPYVLPKQVGVFPIVPLAGEEPHVAFGDESGEVRRGRGVGVCHREESVVSGERRTRLAHVGPVT